MDESPSSTVATDDGVEYQPHEYVAEPLPVRASDQLRPDSRSYMTVTVFGLEDRVTVWTTPVQSREPALTRFANGVLAGDGDAEESSSSD